MRLEKSQRAPDVAAVEKERQKKLLDVVLGVAGDDENMVRDGIIRALLGENDKARRTYLWNILSKAAIDSIRRAHKKVGI